MNLPEFKFLLAWLSQIPIRSDDKIFSPVESIKLKVDFTIPNVCNPLTPTQLH